MSGPEREPRAGGGAVLAVCVLLVGEFLAIFDVSVVNVLLPVVQRDLGAGDAQTYLVVACYGMAYASLLVTGGRLGDRYGIRPLFLVGTGLFGLASVGCGLAPSIEVLVAARAAQGVGAALLFPQVLAGIQTVLPPARRGAAVGAFGAVLGAGSTLGQLGGGVLTRLDLAGSGWRSAFLVNVPVCAAVLVAGRALLPGHRPRAGTGRPDLPGAALLAVTVAAAVLPWSLPGSGPGRSVPALLVVAVAGTAFVRWERRLTRAGGAPLLHTALFRRWTFGVGLVLCLVFFGTQVPFYVVLSQTAQDGAGLSPLASAGLYAGLGTAFLAASVAAGRADPRRAVLLTTCGPALMAAGYLGLSTLRADQLHPADVPATVFLVLNGLGAGVVAPTLIRFVLTGVDAPLSGVASGLLATAQQIANSVGVMIAGALFRASRGSGGSGVLSGFHGALWYFTALAAVTVALAVVVARGQEGERARREAVETAQAVGDARAAGRER
ncbi:MFS transporter [Streptomyces mobaraensis]|uniref:MFS transporter n=1 Tax=Streptomyces mobaraensis TaxID=35621 RepID=A0A5N5WA25_STRMB|nr:MFS transporter [Streptomyces mobaraensis]KAB7845595.1 MFS transporter [Streptomyces mobaraensis]